MMQLRVYTYKLSKMKDFLYLAVIYWIKNYKYVKYYSRSSKCSIGEKDMVVTPDLQFSLAIEAIYNK